MDKNIEQRICLKFCFANGISCAEALKMLHKAYGESTLSKTRAYEWYSAFNNGREVVEDLPRSGRPSTSSNELNAAKVKQMMTENRSLREMGAEISVSHESFRTILKDCFSKVPSKSAKVKQMMTENRSLREMGAEISVSHESFRTILRDCCLSKVPSKSISTPNGALKNDGKLSTTMGASAAEKMLEVNNSVENQPNSRKRGRKRCGSDKTIKDFSPTSEVTKNTNKVLHRKTTDIIQNKFLRQEGKKTQSLNEKFSLQESSNNTTVQHQHCSNEHWTEYDGCTNEPDYNISEIDVNLLIPKVEIKDLSDDGGDDMTESFS